MRAEESNLLGIISTLVRYPLYKNSSFSWLGDLPQHWKITKLRNHLTPINHRNRPDLPLLSVVREKGVIVRNITDREENFNYIPDDLSNYKVVKKGQFAINKMKAWQGSYGVSKFDGIVSPAYYIYNISGVNETFLSVALRSKAYVPFFGKASDGIRIGQWDLSNNGLKTIPFVLPPLDEQKSIVKYLDYVDKRVKKYIRAKQKQIKLLEEMKQAIIHQAVTRGLDPTVPLKPSGVAWLGDVPEHWDILPGKLCIHEKKTPNIGNKISKVLSLSYGKIVERPEEKLHGLVPSSFETYQIIQENDIIVRSTDMQNDHVSWRFGFCTQQGVITSAYLCLQTTELITARFCYYVLHNYDITKDIYRFGSGLRQNLSWVDLKYLPIIVPPKNEQDKIVEYLDDIDQKYSQFSSVLKSQILLVKELKERLVADVVSGKLDVREAASQLPEELEELLEEPDAAIGEEFENGEEMEEAVPEEE